MVLRMVVGLMGTMNFIYFLRRSDFSFYIVFLPLRNQYI